jgi:hypothetical protein
LFLKEKMKKESNSAGGVALLQRSNAIKEGVVSKQKPRRGSSGRSVYGGISLQQHVCGFVLTA